MIPQQINLKLGNRYMIWDGEKPPASISYVEILKATSRLSREPKAGLAVYNYQCEMFTKSWVLVDN